jgi:hypothetical protein
MAKGVNNSFPSLFLLSMLIGWQNVNNFGYIKELFAMDVPHSSFSP